MKWILSMVCLAASITLGFSQDSDKAFDVQSLIANPVKSLPKPIINEALGGPSMLVFSQSMEAQEHVRQGFAWVSASWDFEAYRHFCAAIEADDQCLMAYCGVVLSLTSPQHEFHEQRAIAYNRMLTLAEYKVDGEFFYPENERMYTIAIAELIVGGVSKSARVLQHLARNYPNDTFAQLLANYLSRGGYGDLGRPKVSQQRSIENLEVIVQQNPSAPLPLNYLIMLQADAPATAVDFKNNIAPLSSKLVELSEQKIPTWLELHGYISMRAGDAKSAETAYRSAYRLFREWKLENKVTAADSDVLLRVSLKLAELLYKQDRQDEAVKVLDAVMGISGDFYRDGSAAHVLYRWGLQTFKMKMAIADRDYQRAKESLPAALLGGGDSDPLKDILNAYVKMLDCHLALQAGDDEVAKMLFKDFSKRLNGLIENQATYNKHPGFLEYLRSADGLLVYMKELKGLLSGSDHGYRYWLELAAEVPQIPSRIQPTEVLFPVEYRLGQWFESKSMHEEARQAYLKAYEIDPVFAPTKQAVERLTR